MIEQTSQLKEGTIIQYRLLPAERPTHPSRIWRGRVLQAYTGMRYFLDCCRVESLEPGYEELSELVLISQIVEIEVTEGLQPRTIEVSECVGIKLPRNGKESSESERAG